MPDEDRFSEKEIKRLGLPENQQRIVAEIQPIIGEAIDALIQRLAEHMEVDPSRVAVHYSVSVARSNYLWGSSNPDASIAARCLEKSAALAGELAIAQTIVGQLQRLTNPESLN